jgi:hypothetical protein
MTSETLKEANKLTEWIDGLTKDLNKIKLCKEREETIYIRSESMMPFAVPEDFKDGIIELVEISLEERMEDYKKQMEAL